MNRERKRVYFALASVIMALISLSPRSVDLLRGTFAASLAPSWQWFNTQTLLAQPLPSPVKKAAASNIRRSVNVREELHRVELENLQLRERLRELEELVIAEKDLAAHAKAIADDNHSLSELQQRRRSEMQKLVKMRLDSIPARIIFRSPASWNSSLWLNVGEAHNAAVGRTIVAKNSPVVVGFALVGVVDYVGSKQSRVRLITDTQLTPSVRAVRDGRGLAKGELHGSHMPLWRRHGMILQGVGFNYDFADDEGPARDLRSGKANDGDDRMTIIEVGDLLVTTGMDGVFPPGLHVAEVTTLNPLREGDYYYELEARPAIDDFDDLWLVSVLPPLTSDGDRESSSGSYKSPQSH